MKRKLMLIVAMIAILACLFALSVSAVEPDATKGTVTLNDGTECALYDVNGNALIWYINSSGGYSYVRADSGAGEDGYNGGTVYYKATYGFNSDTNANFEHLSSGVYMYEVSSVRIVDSEGVEFGAKSIVVFNIKDADVKTNDGTSYLNGEVNCLKSVFSGSTNIQYVYCGTNFIGFQASAFNSCKNLKYVNFEELVNLRQINGGNSFWLCTSLFANETIDFSNTSLISVGGSGAIAGNQNGYMTYKEIIFPETLSNFGDYPCQYNNQLTKVVFNSNPNVSGGSQFLNCSKLTEIVGFENFTWESIPSNFMSGCTSITSIKIPETVTSIGANAFKNTGLTRIVVPNSVVTLGQSAFQSNAQLETVVLGAGVTTFSSYDTLNNCPKLTTIYMPAGITGGNLLNTFHNSGNITTVYYTGTLDQLNTFCDSLSAKSGNTNFTNLTKISLADYEKLENKTGKYIIYDYSACDAFYNGIHVESDTVNGNACYLADCSRCNVEKKYIGGDINSATHSFSYAYAYNNGFTTVGTLTSTCANAGCNYCAEKTPDVAELAPIFKNLMYSKREGTEFGIVMTYEIDNDALAVYKSGASTTVNFGVVAIAEEKYNSEKDLVKADGTTEQTNIILADISDTGAKTVELVIKGTGDQWDAHKATPFYILGYYIEGNTVNYFQSASKTAVTDLTTIKFESTSAEEVA